MRGKTNCLRRACPVLKGSPDRNVGQLLITKGEGGDDQGEEEKNTSTSAVGADLPGSATLPNLRGVWPPSEGGTGLQGVASLRAN